jgi:hypothetical protein
MYVCMYDRITSAMPAKSADFDEQEEILTDECVFSPNTRGLGQ